MDEQSEMGGPPPSACTAVATAARCAAGRVLAHPTRPGWDTPCPRPGTERFRMFDGGATTWLDMCMSHVTQLIADGLA